MTTGSLLEVKIKLERDSDVEIKIESGLKEANSEEYSGGNSDSISLPLPSSLPLTLHQCNDDVCGRLLPLPDGSHAHANCIRWSSEVVERGGRLINALQAKSRASRNVCTLCLRKGASVGCFASQCKRSFHLKCAIAAHCTLLEARLRTEKEDSPHEVVTLVACPEHFNRLDTSKLYRKWRPHDPKRSLIVRDSEDIESESLADQLAQGHRADRAVRCGSSTVLTVGLPTMRADLIGFHTASHIYPLHFRSTRIFWSMSVPLARTLYIFEILSESDIENFSEETLLENKILEKNKIVDDAYDNDDHEDNKSIKDFTSLLDNDKSRDIESNRDREGKKEFENSFSKEIFLIS